MLSLYIPPVLLLAKLSGELPCQGVSRSGGDGMPLIPLRRIGASPFCFLVCKTSGAALELVGGSATAKLCLESTLRTALMECLHEVSNH